MVVCRAGLDVMVGFHWPFHLPCFLICGHLSDWAATCQAKSLTIFYRSCYWLKLPEIRRKIYLFAAICVVMFSRMMSRIAPALAR